MNIIHMDLRLHRGFRDRVREKERFQRGKEASGHEKSRLKEPGLGCPRTRPEIHGGLTCKRTEGGG